MSSLPVVTDPRTKVSHVNTAHRLEASSFLSVKVANIALFVWLAGVLVFGRAFSEIGVEPIFVPDVLAIVGTVLSLPRWWPVAQKPGVRGLLLISAALAILTAQSVYRGAEAGYPSALKSACMGVYPIVATAIAGLIAREPDLIERFAKRVLPFVPLGSLLVGLGGGSYIAAAVGLYLAYAGAWAVAPGNLRRSMIAVGTLVGTGYLVGVGARRGPTLAVLLAMIAARIATGGRIGAEARRPYPHLVIVGCFSISLLAATTLVTLNNGNLTDASDLPIIGPLVSRVIASTHAGTESGNNIELRWEMWRSAVQTTAAENPLFGRGAGQPIRTVLGSMDVADPKSGVHNSFVGYALYMGFPSTLLVVLAFLLALFRVWRSRALPGRASLFGAVIAAAATCMTNVALETPYIGGPAWAIVGATLGASVSLSATTPTKSGDMRCG
jgi:hypothetical protein